MKIQLLAIIFSLFATVANAQNMDDKVKTLANEIADQVIKSSNKKVSNSHFDLLAIILLDGKEL